MSPHARTWDDLKRMRDGTTAPLRTNPGETAGDAAYRRDQMVRLAMLERERREVEGEIEAFEAKIADLCYEMDEIREELGLDETTTTEGGR